MSQLLTSQGTHVSPGASGEQSTTWTNYWFLDSRTMTLNEIKKKTPIVLLVGVLEYQYYSYPCQFNANLVR